MSAKNVKNVCITITPIEADIVDRFRRMNYTMNQSEAYRALINAGAKVLLNEKKPKAETNG